MSFEEYSYVCTIYGTMTQHSSIVEAQRRQFSQFTMQDMMDPEQFRAKAEWALFKPYYEERLVYNRSTRTLPVVDATLSSICFENPLTDEREVYQCFVHFNPKVAPNRDSDYRLALGNKLMDKVSSWKGRMLHKPLMDVTLTKPDGHVMYQMGNMDVCPQCMKKAVCYYYVNQAIMDQLADKLLNAWRSDASTFVLQFTLHD